MKLRKVIIVASGFVIIVGSFALNGFLASQKEPPKKEEVVVPVKYVKTAKVRYGDIPTEVIAFGRVRTSESLDLIAEISGRMTRGNVPLKEGSKFKKGDLLIKVDDTEAKLNLQANKSNFLRDLAAILPDLKLDFPESYTKWQQYFESINLDQPLPPMPPKVSSKEKIFLATKNIFSSFYNIKSEEAALRKYRVYAPFDGIISEVNLQSGSFVNPGNNVAKLKRTDKLEIKVQVELGDIEWIKRNEKVTIATEDGRMQWRGVISRIGELVNENTQSIDVFIELDKNNHPVYDGIYLKSEIPGKLVKDAMEIPRNAIFNGNQVFVVQDSLLKSKEIMVHKVTPETVIFSGLEVGSDLVIEPLINAYTNMKVAILSEEGDGEIDMETKKTPKAKLVNN